LVDFVIKGERAGIYTTRKCDVYFQNETNRQYINL